MERVINRLAKQRVAVIGAGWAGIAAVKSLLEQGVQANQICLIERAPHVGGRAFSFADRQTGLELDNGQHVLLGCCEASIALLADFGLEHGVRFQPLLDLPIFHEGRWSRIASRRLAGALHMLPSLMAYQHLKPVDRLRLFTVATKLLNPNAKALDTISFGEWLRSLGQTDEAILQFWDLLGTGVLNAHADDVSAGLAAQSFHIGVVNGYDNARFGLFEVPLGKLAEEAVAELRRKGVEVRLSTFVSSINNEGNQVSGLRLRDGEVLPIHHVISAVPHDALLRMLPDAWRSHPSMQQFADFRWSPILNLFFHFNQPVMDDDVFASTSAGGMFVFNRGRLLHPGQLDGRLLSVSISAADVYRGLDPKKIETMVLRAIEEACPRARSAKLLSCSTVWQPLATFLAEPGTWRLRPNAKTDFEGLLLAGDWTNTGWPACIEGAVLSGQAAVAAAALDWTL